MTLINTNLIETKIINKQLFYMLEGTEEYGPEPVVQAVDVARNLGYKRPDNHVNHVITKFPELFENRAFLMDLEIDVTPRLRGAHKSKKTLTRARKSQKTWVLTEPGMYAFIAKSNSKQASEQLGSMVDLFAKMRKFLLRQARKERKQAWIEHRQSGKAVRRDETDRVKIYNIRADSQGSKNSERYYLHFSLMAKKAIGIDKMKRDEMSEDQLKFLAKIEDEITFLLAKGEMKEIYYKDLYQEIKKSVNESGAYYLSQQKETLEVQK